jgi:hypothetical protein
MGAAAVPLLVATTVGTTAYQISESRKARKAATSEADRQRAEQAALESEQNEKEKRERFRSNRMIDIARRSALASFGRSGDRSGTVRTSPLGLPGGGNIERKTLLGQ